MRLLLDMHTFLWFLLDDPRLSRTARGLIDGPTNDIEISPATYWEIAIKISLGKYALPEPYDVFIQREIATNDFRILPIEPMHTAVLITLPYHHRDPFDRLLIVQAMVEAMPILSNDTAFDAYPVTRAVVRIAMNTGVVTQYLCHLITKQVEDYRLVAWYDPERAYATTDAQTGLALLGYRFLLRSPSVAARIHLPAEAGGAYGNIRHRLRCGQLLLDSRRFCGLP